MSFNIAAQKSVETGKKILQSKYFWYFVIAVVIFILLRRYWYIIKGKLKPIEGDFGTTISSERKDELKEVAGQVSESINPDVSSFWDARWAKTDREDILWIVQGFNDAEFLFFVRHYRDRYGNFRSHLSGVWLPLTNVDEALISRMDKMGV